MPRDLEGFPQVCSLISVDLLSNNYSMSGLSNLWRQEMRPSERLSVGVSRSHPQLPDFNPPYSRDVVQQLGLGLIAE
jgi:hypothetical protein